MQVYLKTCQADHGFATLSCKPKTGHHTKGAATSCISSKCVKKLLSETKLCTCGMAPPITVWSTDGFIVKSPVKPTSINTSSNVQTLTTPLALHQVHPEAPVLEPGMR